MLVRLLLLLLSAGLFLAWYINRNCVVGRYALPILSFRNYFPNSKLTDLVCGQRQGSLQLVHEYASEFEEIFLALFNGFRTVRLVKAQNLSFLFKVGEESFGLLADAFDLVAVGLDHFGAIVLFGVVEFVTKHRIIDAILEAYAFQLFPHKCCVFRLVQRQVSQKV
jgi:hypothetical protein